MSKDDSDFVKEIECHAPSSTLVAKKARFLVSNGFSLVNSVPRDCASASPVKDELSTWNMQCLESGFEYAIKDYDITQFNAHADSTAIKHVYNMQMQFIFNCFSGSEN